MALNGSVTTLGELIEMLVRYQGSMQINFRDGVLESVAGNDSAFQVLKRIRTVIPSIFYDAKGTYKEKAAESLDRRFDFEVVQLPNSHNGTPRRGIKTPVGILLIKPKECDAS